METPVPPFTLRYELTPDVFLDASALAQAGIFRLIRVAIVGLVAVAVFIAAVAFLLDDLSLLWFTVFILVMAGLVFALTQGRWLMRWSMRRSAGSMLGGMAEVVVDNEGITTVTPLGKGSVGWSQLTGVRENERTVLFVRDRLPAAFVPAAAFDSPDLRTAVVQFARERIAASRSEPTT